MQLLWTWGGLYFGYRDADVLFARDGRAVGRFVGSFVFGGQGQHLGEVLDGRLIVIPRNLATLAPVILPAARVATVPAANIVPAVMLPGARDFPEPDKL